MNKKKLLELADLMENAPDQPAWDMSDTDTRRGCLITSACQLFEPAVEPSWVEAVDRLGVDNDCAHGLFQPNWTSTMDPTGLPSLGSPFYTKPRAVAALLLMAGGDETPWQTLYVDPARTAGG